MRVEKVLVLLLPTSGSHTANAVTTPLIHVSSGGPYIN